MRPPNIIGVLNRALATIYRSLPMFVDLVDPWTHPGDERGEQLLANIVADQKLYGGKLAELVLDLGGSPDAGAFPMMYTDLHLLSLDYLLVEITEQQHRDVATLAECVADAASNARAKALLEEVLGNARGHLESLEQVVGQAAK